MNINVQCPCGSRYLFDAEPQDGRMPFAVNCPTCGADGTETANALIAEALAEAPTAPAGPRLRMAAAAAPSHAAEAPAQQTREDMVETRRAVAEMQERKKRAEERSYRLAKWGVCLFALVALALAGGWGWYAFSGSQPRQIGATTFGGAAPASVAFVGTNEILMIDGQKAVLRDIKQDRDLWTATLDGKSGAEEKPRVIAHDPLLWVCLGDEIISIDHKTGVVKNTFPVTGRLETFTPTDPRWPARRFGKRRHHPYRPPDRHDNRRRETARSGHAAFGKTRHAQRIAAERPAHRRRAPGPVPRTSRNSGQAAGRDEQPVSSPPAKTSSSCACNCSSPM